MRTFLIIWFGQFISLLGSGMTGFGLSVWIFEQTGEATPIALTALSFSLPRVLLLPLAGPLADRLNRRRIMIAADSGAALSTALVALLLFSGNLQIWHIYLTTALSSAFGAFQDPAHRASITMLVPKQHLVRAGGLQQMGAAGQAILIPVIAGGLYLLIGLRGIILLDFASFFFAIGALQVVHIPQPVAPSGGSRSDDRKSKLREATFGWNYLRLRPGLLGLLLYYAGVNFFLSLSGVLVVPLVLSFGTAAELGLIRMAGGLAMLTGGLLMSVWGGPNKGLVPGIILAVLLNGFGYFLYGLRASTPLLAIAAFLVMFFIAISSALSQALWQRKVAPGVQGRVFAIRAMIAYSIVPFANLAAGPLADRLFEPLMAVGGPLSTTFIGNWLGVGKGRGVGLLFIISALFLWSLSLAAFASPRLRNLEREIPDAVADQPGGASQDEASPPARPQPAARGRSG